MRYVFVDDSALAYDGYTPLRRPLGGPEKAMIGLTSALQERGHDVKVINHVSYAHMAEGAYWTPFGDAMAPKSADILIALRKPLLLGTLRAATHRILWVVGAPEYLMASVNDDLWDSFAASMMFIGENQRRAYKGAVRRSVIVPGVAGIYYESKNPSDVVAIPVPDEHGYDPHAEIPSGQSEAERAVAAAANVAPPLIPPPHAVVTTHPLQGLAWVVDVWTKAIHPRMPEARLSIYSAVLSKGLKGEDIPVNIIPILQQVVAALAANVVVVEPRNDEGMAKVYRESRVHLYPGDAQDYACWTLGESQAAGLPAVARALGGVGERIDNGQSGYIVPDAEGFASVALQILGNDAVYRNLNDAAADPARRRTWTMAAAELDGFIATLPAA